MALSAVKATKIVGAGASVTATSLTATAGSALVVGSAGYYGSSAPGALTMTRTGDTWTTDNAVTATSGTGFRAGFAIASAPNVGASAQNLVVALALAEAISAFALEVGGCPTSSIRDATSPAAAVGSGTTATANSLTNATADAIFVQFVASESGANPATMTKDAAYTTLVGAVTMSETNGSANQVAAMAYRIVSSIGAQTPAYTTSSAPWGTHIAVYKAAAGAAGIPPGLGPALHMSTPMQMPPP